MAKRSQKKKSQPEISRGNVPEGKEVFSGKSSGVGWTTLLQALVISAAVLWIYWPVLDGGWLWDDDLAITDNSMTQSPTGLWSIWFEPGHQIDYYPIKSSVQWLQWHLWGMETLGYHLTNIVLHVLGSLLVWRLLSKFHLRLAWLGGLIFAIHPVQVESVAWISELKNTLSLPAFLLAMCAWIDYEERGKAKDYGLALGLFVVAMLCKLSVVLFPLVILLYAWWRRGRMSWNDLKISAPFFGAALLLGMITLFSGIYDVRFNHADPGAMPVGGLLARLVAAGLSLSFYFSKSFLPAGLLPIYPKWPIDPSSPVQFLPWLVLGGVICFLWTKRQSWGRHALLGLGFFLINLGPCPGFIPAPDMAFTWVMDHFLYLPIIGLIGLVVAALGRMEMRAPIAFRPFGTGFVVVVLALLACQSRSYAKLFINSETLWTYELQYNQEAYPAYNNLGTVLIEKDRFSDAMNQFEQALLINPDYALAHNNLGTALADTGRLPEAMDQFEEALRIDPNYAGARNNLGLALLNTGRMSQAMEQFERTLRIKPDYAEAYCNLGNALLQAGRLPEAKEQYLQALKINPDNAEAHTNLGNVLFQTGRLAEAMEQYRQVLRTKPDDAEAHNNLGYALGQTGRLTEAMEQYEQALRIKPDYATARENLARAQALQKTAPAKK
jgi:tetratricopeptide (TPR) repeat protein